MAHVDLTNPDLFEGTSCARRSKRSTSGACARSAGSLFERIRIKNYNPFEVTLEVELRFGADFADIFEIRGMTERRSTGTAPTVTARDRVRARGPGRRPQNHADPVRAGSRSHRRGGRARHGVLPLRLEPHQTRLVTVTVEPTPATSRRERARLRPAVHELRRSLRGMGARVDAHRHRQRAVQRAARPGLRDLRALYTPVDGGGVLAAGIPWYVTIFGRDGADRGPPAADVNTRLAREVLTVLADARAPSARLARRAARQDPPRGRRASSRAPDPAALAVLRLGGLDAVVPDPRGAALSAGPATSASRASSCPRPRPRCAGSTSTATWTATASSSTEPIAAADPQPGMEGLVRRVVHADGDRRAADRAVEVQAYVYLAKPAWPTSIGASDRRRTRPAGARAERLRRGSTRRSGWRTSGSSRSHSTATSGRCAPSPRTPATPCTATSSTRSTRTRSPDDCWPPTCSAAGASGP
jgi:hypothetical protein